MRGTLFLIVGPSGAGKDSLIIAARERLGGGYVFPQRTITRARRPDDEDHAGVGIAQFDELERDGAFALSWRAHGNCYGIPASITADLERGAHVVVNVSRDIVADARTRFAPVRVIEVTAPPDILAARLVERGRERDDAIRSRLARSVDLAPDARIANDGALSDATDAFVAALMQVEK